MSKSNIELAVDLAIAHIQASSIIKDDGETGTMVPLNVVCEVIENYYGHLEGLTNAE